MLLVPAWAGTAFKADKELYLLVAGIAVLLLGRPLYSVFWRVLTAAGVHDARRRWGRQPRWIRALPLAAAAGLVLLIVWARGTQPSFTLIVLLGIIFALYILPARLRQYAIPVTVLAIAVAYPILYAQNWLWRKRRADLHVSPDRRHDGDDGRLHDDGTRAEHGRRLCRPARSRVRGLLRDRGLLRRVVCLPALRPTRLRDRPAVHRHQLRRGRRVSRRRRHSHLHLARPSHRGGHHGLRGNRHRPADAATTRGLPCHRHARLRGDGRPGRPERRPGRSRLQPHERPPGDQPHRHAWFRVVAPRQPRPAGELPHALRAGSRLSPAF